MSKGLMADDVINGDDGPNMLKGLDGMDTINGHGEDDTILPNRPAGQWVVANTSATMNAHKVTCGNRWSGYC